MHALGHQITELKGEVKDLLRRREHQTWPILFCLYTIVLPFILFAYLSYIMRSSFRHHSFWYAMAFGPLLCLGITVAASMKTIKGLRRGKPDRNALVFSLCFWFAFGTALYLGEMNWRQYAFAYYNYQDLAMYTNIDPARDKGESYMDAGSVYFKESSTILTSKAIAYQNAGVYCAAPIVRQPIEVQGTAQAADVNVQLPESGTIDFWAVGQDCCDTTGQNFKCGAVGKPFARSGLRMLRDDVRPFYLMAVQEWNAWIGLPSKHPLFFHWVEDPIVEVDNYLLKVASTYWMNVWAFLGANVCLCLMAFWGLKQAGLDS